MRKKNKHDASKIKYECREGAVVLWVVQKIKGRKKDRGRAKWAWVEIGFGPVWPTNLGSVRERYLRLVRPFFLIFPFSFSLFSLFHSVLSLKNTNVFFKTRQIPATVSGGSSGGWPAGAAPPPRQNPKLIFLKFFCSILFYSFPSILFPT